MHVYSEVKFCYVTFTLRDCSLYTVQQAAQNPPEPKTEELGAQC